MDEVRKVAKAYYNGAAAAEQKLAREFFRSLDTNADGKVSRREYEKAVANSSSFTDNDFFEELDADCNKTLDFDEVLALYYLEKVSVPRCRTCQSLLLDSYFSCLRCQASVSYYLCCDCYGRGSFKHRHPSHKFVDTRAMLKLLDQILKQSQITNHQTDEFDLMQNDVEGAEEGEDHEEVEGVEKDEPTEHEKEEVEVAEVDEEEEKEEEDEEEEEEDEEEVEVAEEDEEEVEGAEKDEEVEDEVEEKVGAEKDKEEEDGEGNEVDKCVNPNPTVNAKESEKTKKNVKVGEKQSDSRRSSNMETIAKSLKVVNTAASIGNVVVTAASVGSAVGSAVGALGAGASVGNIATTAAIAAAATCRIM